MPADDPKQTVGITNRAMQFVTEQAKEDNPFFMQLSYYAPVNTPEDVRIILDKTDAHGFVGASSLERMGVEKSLTDLTRQFKSLTLKK